MFNGIPHVHIFHLQRSINAESHYKNMAKALISQLFTTKRMYATRIFNDMDFC